MMMRVLTMCSLVLFGAAVSPECCVKAYALQNLGGEEPTRVLTPSDLKGLSWRNIGPANMGGRLAAIAVAPSEPKVIFLGFGTGGVWKSTNGGTTFSPAFDQEATSSIGSIVICDAPAEWAGWAEEDAKAKENSKGVASAEEDSKSPEQKTEDRAKQGKSKIVWVGTGEGNGRNSSSWGSGVYRSTDGGSTFTSCGLAQTHDIPAMAADPRNPDVCYAAAMGHLWGPNEDRGLYKTGDGGKTWNKVLFLNADTGCIDVVINPSNPDVIYAAMYARRRTAYSFQSGGPEGGIYKSADAGATWTKLSNGLPATTGRIGLDIQRDNPETLIAVVQSDEGGVVGDAFADVSRAGGVFRTDDAGATWARTSDFNPRAFYFSKIRFDPVSAERVYLLGWELYISDDGGKTFRAGAAKTPHVDFHSLAFDPTDADHVFIGTDGGLYETRDRCDTWQFHNDMAVGQFYNVGVSMGDPYMVGGGLQDNGTWIGPSETLMNSGSSEEGGMGRGGGITNADWRSVWGGDGFHIAFDPTNEKVVYAESQGGYLGRIDLATGIARMLIPVAREGQPGYRFNWNSPFFISPHDPTVLYLGGNRVFRFLERGDKYAIISPDLSTENPDKILTVGSSAETHGTVVSLAESPIAKGVLWAGTDDGQVQVTCDDGATWTNVTPAAVKGFYISKIEPSHFDSKTAYLSVDGHRSDFFDPILLMTSDLGVTWSSIASDLPSGSLPSTDVRSGESKEGILGGPVKVIREDLSNPRVLFCGTERAAFFSYDQGQHWIRLNGESLPTVAVDDLVIHPRERDLVAGTHGRSIWIMDDISPLSQMTEEVVQSQFHLFQPLSARPRYRMGYDGLWCDQMFIAQNPELGAAITYWVKSWSDKSVSISIKDEKGREVRHLDGGVRPGLNRVMWDLQGEAKERLPNPDGLPTFVPPGKYTVEASLGKDSASVILEVLEAPTDRR